MIVKLGSQEVEVGVSDSTPFIDFAIKWVEIGGVWKGHDKGIYPQFSADITISCVNAKTVSTVRSILHGAVSVGSPIHVIAEDHECLFGPMINYEWPIWCTVVANESAFSTTNLNENGRTEFSFTLIAENFLFARRLYIGLESMPDLRILSVSRLDNPKAQTMKFEDGASTMGLSFKAPTAEVVYEGSRDDIARALCFLIEKRVSVFTFTSPRVWLFEKDVYSWPVKLITISLDGPLDSASTEYGITVMYGRGS